MRRRKNARSPSRTSAAATLPAVAPAIVRGLVCFPARCGGGDALGEAAEEDGIVVERDDVCDDRVVDVSVDEEEDMAAGSDDRKSAASSGFEDRKPAVRSPAGHPSLQGLLLQQPRNGGCVEAQVYHRLPVGHC